MSSRIRTIAVIVAAALSLLAVTAAAVPAKAPRAGPRAGSTMLTTQAEVERALGPPAGTIYIAPGRVERSGGVGPRTPATSNITIVLDGVSSGVIVAVIQQVASHPKVVVKLVKKYILKGTGKHIRLVANAGDGDCIADFHEGSADSLANCGDKHGIFWTYSSEGKLWDTYTGGMNIASSLKTGTKLYTEWPAKDWYTWTYDDICASAGCNKAFYGVDWILYNAQGHGISDNASGSG